MDPFIRRTIGFVVLAGDADGMALCRMFNLAISSGAPQNTSALITPLSFVITNGKQTRGDQEQMKSGQCCIHH